MPPRHTHGIRSGARVAPATRGARRRREQQRGAALREQAVPSACAPSASAMATWHEPNRQARCSAFLAVRERSTKAAAVERQRRRCENAAQNAASRAAAVRARQRAMRTRAARVRYAEPPPAAYAREAPCQPRHTPCCRRAMPIYARVPATTPTNAHARSTRKRARQKRGMKPTAESCGKVAQVRREAQALAC